MRDNVRDDNDDNDVMVSHGEQRARVCVSAAAAAGDWEWPRHVTDRWPLSDHAIDTHSLSQSVAALADGRRGRRSTTPTTRRDATQLNSTQLSSEQDWSLVSSIVITDNFTTDRLYSSPAAASAAAAAAYAMQVSQLTSTAN